MSPLLADTDDLKAIAADYGGEPSEAPPDEQSPSAQDLKALAAQYGGAPSEPPPLAPPRGGTRKNPALDTPAGLLTPGNISNLYNRPVLQNEEGTVSTTSSSSWNIDGQEVLLPTVVDGKRLTDQEAQDRYRQTGEHLGIFDTPENADAYASALHDEQVWQMFTGKPDNEYLRAAAAEAGGVPSEAPPARAGTTAADLKALATQLGGVPSGPPPQVLAIGGKEYATLPEGSTDLEADVISRSQPAQQSAGMQTYKLESPPRPPENLRPPQEPEGPQPQTLLQRMAEVGRQDPDLAFGQIAAPAADVVMPVGRGLAKLTNAVKGAANIPHEVGRAVASVAHPDLPSEKAPLTDALMDPVSDALEGALEVASPLLLPAVLAAPAATTLVVGMGMVANYGGAKATEKLGGTPSAQRFVGNILGMATMIGIGGPELKALSEKGKAGADALLARAAKSAQAHILAGKLSGGPIGRTASASAWPGDVGGIPLEAAGIGGKSQSETISRVAREEAAARKAAYEASAPERAAAEKAAAEQAAAEAPREYSSTQVQLPEDVATKVRALGEKIPDADLAPQGRETDIHVTLKFGGHGDDPEEVRKVLENEPPITVTLGKTIAFEAGDDGVPLVIEVDSPDLHRMNAMVAEALPHTDTFPEYRPHATVAYVKAGTEDKYVGDTSLEGQSVTVDSIVFSAQDGTKTEIPLKGTAGTTASVPFMITKRMEADLRAAGYSQAAIDQMTPAIAHETLASLAKEGAPSGKQLDEGVSGAQPPAGDTGAAPAAPGVDATGEKPAQEPEKPAAPPVERPTWPDGRQKAQVGEKVYQVVRGFGGTPAHILGEVYEAKNGQLRVKLTGSHALIGSAQTGKTYALDENWTVVGDPIVEKRRQERAEKDKADKEAAEKEHAEYRTTTLAKAQAQIDAGTHTALTRDTPVGSRVVDHWQDEVVKVVEQSEHGPVLKGASGTDYTIGKAEDDGTWGGYSVTDAKASEASDDKETGEKGADSTEKEPEDSGGQPKALADYKPGDRVIIDGHGPGVVLDPPVNGKGDRLRVDLDKVVKGGDAHERVYPMVGDVRPDHGKAPAKPAEPTTTVFKVGDRVVVEEGRGEVFRVAGGSLKIRFEPNGALSKWIPFGRVTLDVDKEPLLTEEEGPITEGTDDGENGPVAGGEEGPAKPERPGGRRTARPGGQSGTRTGGQTSSEPRPSKGAGQRGTVPTEPGGGDGTGVSTPGKDASVAPEYYHITDADGVGTGTPRERVNRNFAAIRVIRTLETEERPATPDEQAILVKYVGWGGLSRIFETWKHGASDAENRYWQDSNATLRDLLTEDEYARARNSTQNAHYTSPTVIRGMWAAVQRLGITHGSALEPSAGIGHFVGLMPAALRRMPFALVEKDTLTAKIAAALYPGAYTQAKPFEQAALPPDHFALVISNVPFGLIPITDPTFSGSPFLKARIHNYFFAKALDYVAPGGLVAFVTTHGTLDASDSKRVREYLGARADFLGAIRLPFTAFKANAGTEVITDIIFLRKRHKDEEPHHAGPWFETTQIALPNKHGVMVDQYVNEYIQAHPEMVLGTHASTGKQRAEDQYNVEPSGNLAEQLAQAIQHLPKGIIDLSPPDESLKAFEQTQPPLGSRPFEYLIHEGRLAQIVDGKITPVTLLKASDVARIKGLLPVRAAVRKVYDLMAEDADDAAIKAAQQDLNRAYDAFVKAHGFISSEANWKAFHEDPDLPLVLSLEDYDDELEKATKTAVFTTRTMKAERRARKAESPAQALQLTLGELGRVDVARLGELLDLTPEEAAETLQAAGLILDTPSGWDIPGRYLSGNVRVKLREAEAAAKLDPRYQGAVDALKTAVPETIPSHKINIRLGASWVPVPMVREFIQSILPDRQDLTWTIRYSPIDALWSIDGEAGAHSSRFATPAVDTKKMLLSALNDKRLTIRRTVQTAAGPRTMVDAPATALARQQREEVHKAFREWLFNDDEARREWAITTYNDKFNAYNQPVIDGSYLTFPGMAQYWRDRIDPHQRNAVARALLLGNILLAHVVGAGKTLTMVTTGMEMRRLGLARKPLYVVPNHLVTQWPAEFLNYYPNAKLLIARPEDLEQENRKRFTARIASGDWDGVVMPYSAFVRVSMSPDAEMAYHRELLDEIEAAILQAWNDLSEQERHRAARGGRRPPSIKQLENVRDRIQSKLDKLAARPKDEMLWFEQLGVDALLVDEAHFFKNLYFHTRQQAAGIPQDNDAQRASDLYLKVRYLNNLTNYRNVVLATGTPVSNSMAEVYVMQKLLQENALERAGIAQFDAWLGQFGHITVETELDPSGTGMAQRARLAKFRNLPDLAAMFRNVADVQMIDDLPKLKAARPKLRGGEQESITIPMTEEQLRFLEALKHRADHLDPKDRRTDNMAKITVDGRLSSLDMRLIDRRIPDNPDSKLNRIAREVHNIWEETTKVRGTQLVFMDSGTPGAEERSAKPKKERDPVTGNVTLRPPTDAERHRGLNLYRDLKQKLVRQGIPAEEIAFIHDIDDVPEKKRDGARKSLFRRVKEGKVRILIGSSGKMGTGMNVQDRLVALHNVDPTYKPSETEQRNGRILRQGNLLAKADPNFRIRILNYITEGVNSSFGFDAYMWQLNEAKAKIIADFFHGDLKAMERDPELDLEQTVFTAGQFKAVATGNPLIIEEGKARSEVERLALVREGFEESQREAQWKLSSSKISKAGFEKKAARIEATAEVVTPEEEPLTATIGKEKLEGHKAVGEAIMAIAKKETTESESHPGKWSTYASPRHIGTIRGIKLWLEPLGTSEPHLVMRHPSDEPERYGSGNEGEPSETTKHFAFTAKLFVTTKDAKAGGVEWRDPTGLMRAVDTRLTDLKRDHATALANAEYYDERIKAAERVLGTTFGQQAEYDAALAKLEDILRRLGQTGKDETIDQGMEDDDEIAGDDDGTPSAQFARKHVETTGLEVDREALGQVLGSSLYSEAAPTTAVKEMVQNAADAVRDKPDGHVEVYIHLTERFDQMKGGYVEVRDNGAGMTVQQLKDYFLTLGGSGKRSSETASGGFGLAKASPLLGGAKIALTTTVQVKKGVFGSKLQRFSFEGTPQDILHRKLDIYEEDVPAGATTGTHIRVEYAPGTRIGVYEIEAFLGHSVGSTAIPRLTQYTEEYDFGQGRSNGLLTPERLQARENRVQKFDTFPRTYVFGVKGAGVEVHAAPIEEDGKMSIPVKLYNNGLYQLHTAVGHGGGIVEVPNLPEQLHVNIKPTVPEGDPAYPFTANRETLNAAFEQELRTKLVEHIKPFLDAYLAIIAKSFSETPSLGDSDVKVFDLKGRITPADVEALSESNIVAMFSDVVGVARGMIGLIYPEKQAQVTHIGVLLTGDGNGGARLKSGLSKKAQMGVYINPFAPLQHLVDTATGEDVANGIYHLLLHEITHLAADTEGASFTWELFKNDTRVGQARRNMFIREIKEAIDDPRGRSDAFSRAHAIYQEITGRKGGRTSALVEGASRIERPDAEPREQDPFSQDARRGRESAGPRTVESDRGGSPPGAGAPTPLGATAGGQRPVAVPEMVALANELARTPSVVKRFRGAGRRGDFNPGSGTIRLASYLFEPGNEQQLAATLAHEFGHLVDWLPHQTLKRGNILGRIYSLRSFMKRTFVSPDGKTITLPSVRAELIALSNAWRPWDEALSSASFAAYRKSSKELFADAISVLLNDPARLQQEAPIFFEQFFVALDAKPAVKLAYEGLQELLSGTPEELIARRQASVSTMFSVGDTMAIDLERLRQQERLAGQRDLWFRFRVQMVDKNTPLIDRVIQLETRGVRINPDDDPRYFLEERNYMGGKVKAFTERYFQPIYKDLTAAGVTWNEFGRVLFYERIIAGDRSEMANPKGFNPADATALLDDLMRPWTPEQRVLVRASVTQFRAAVRMVVDAAYDAGLYTDALYKQMVDNPAYATFRVLDHIESRLTSRVHRQIGTLKDIQNVADATMLKTLVTIRATEYQKMKVAAFDFLHQHFPDDIEQAKEIGSAKGRRPIEPPDRTKQRLVTYFERGHLRGKYVDHYIADSLENASVGTNSAVVSALRTINSRLFRPVFTTYNPGFQTFNATRDFLRFWKNIPDMTMARAIMRYKEAAPMAWRRAFGLPDNATPAQRQAYEEMLQAEEAQIFSVTYNALNNGRTVEDSQIEETLASLGLGESKTTSGVLATIKSILGYIEKVGNFIESLPKAAAIYEYKGQGSIADIPPDLRSYIRRKIGSPDFLAGGTYKPITNELLLFSNAITQAIRADYEVAVGPTTRAAFWWKTAKLNILPKLIAFAILFALAAWAASRKKRGEPPNEAVDTLIKAFSGASEYDLTNYIVLPIWIDAQGNSVYVRLPQDDAGRLIGGLTWKLLRTMGGDRDMLASALQVFDYTAGQFPGLTPTLNVPTDLAQFAAGQNVYDPFRNQFLFTDDEVAARDLNTLRKFVGYEFQQLGGGILWKFYPGEQRPQAMTPGQKILDFPVLSNIGGRWLRITSYGRLERLRETQAGVKQTEARTRLEERKAVNEAIRTYYQRPAAEQTEAVQIEAARGITRDLYSDLPPDERGEKTRNILKKLKMGASRGQDELVDAVVSSTSNAQKLAVILKAAEGMTSTEFDGWLSAAVRAQVVSSELRRDILRARPVTVVH